MSGRGEGALAGAVVLAGAAPLWAGRFLPFLDMPQHLGLASVLARYADPATGFARYYALDRAVDPYWGYLAPMWLLTRVVSLELANRLLLSAWAVALPLSVGYALQALGRDWRWAAFALPLVWHENLFFGFAPFLVSMPILFVALGLLARWLGGEEPRREGRLACAAAALFLAHVQTYLLFGASAVTLLAAQWRGARWALGRLRPLVPSLVLFGAWLGPAFLWNRASGAPLHTPRYTGYGTLLHLGAAFEPLAETLGRAPERLWGMYADGSGVAAGAAWIVLLLLAVALAGGRPPGSGEEDLRAALRARPGELLAVVALACYLFLPARISGQWYLNGRYLVFAALLAPAFVSGAATGFRRGLAASAAALALLCDANAVAKVAAFQQQAGAFGQLLDRMEPGRRALGLVFDAGGGPVRQPLFLHFAAYYQALRGGDVGFSFAGLPSIPLRYREGAQAPHPGEWAPQDFRWDEMGPSYDYFLVRGTPRGDAARLAEHADEVAEGAGFTLWRRRDPGRPAR
ncbi:MAG TPA: hypothetical protein VMT17_11360 [Anaeromyxobacteraceae bacterium]|nr:hypothetical protein [Anaeromyxobacteraceae bacterium]